MSRHRSGRSQRSPEPLPPAEVLELLRAAHKRRTASNRWLYESPGKWDRTWDQHYAWQTLCSSVSDLILRQPGQRPPPEVERLHKLIDRGQDAINELRRVLPEYIAHLHKEAERGPNALLFLAGDGPTLEREWQVGQKQEIQNYIKMLSSLINFESGMPKYRSKAIWRDLLSLETYAVEIFEEFQHCTGKASTSRNGPAVRFIGLVLARAGVHMSAAAIEKMLRRNENIRPKRDAVEAS